MDPLTERNFRFADFELVTSKRLLLKDGAPLSLNSKTFDLLEALVERRGEILSKDELLERIWQGQFVEESNLTVQVSTLRKLLGENPGENRFIVTVPGKGYKFVGEAADAADDLVVENHSYSRIVIDEQTREIEPAKLTGQASPARKYYVFALSFGVLLIAATAYYVLRHPWNRSLPFVQKQVKQLTNNGKVRTAALSADGKLFAYVTDENGMESLRLAPIDGGNEIVLRPPSDARYYSLIFSQDGGTLFFTMRDEGEQSAALYRMRSFGGVQEKVVDHLGYFALSADASKIAYTRRDDAAKEDGVYVADLNGDEHLAASVSITRFLSASSLSFSPDGQSLAFGASAEDSDLSQELFIVPVTGGEKKQVSASGSFGNINRTAWLADGRGVIASATQQHVSPGVPKYKIWYVSLADGKTTAITADLSSYADGLGVSGDGLLTVENRQVNNTWVAPANDLKQARQITFGSFGRYDGLWGLDWTASGRIVFDSSDTESQVISIMDADGANRKQLTAPGQVDSALSVSNDGRYAVFHSTRGGGFDIWRMEIASGNLMQLTFGKKNYQPAISADSRFVYYKAWEDGVGELLRVPIDGGDAVAITDKETSWPSCSPDGKYLAALYRTDRSRLAIFTTDGGTLVRQFDVPKTSVFFGGTRWTPDSQAVVFKDSGNGYWRQPVDGGEAVRIEDLPKERLYDFAWSKDGKMFAFVRGEEISDVVLFRDLK